MTFDPESEWRHRGIKSQFRVRTRITVQVWSEPSSKEQDSVSDYWKLRGNKAKPRPLLTTCEEEPRSRAQGASRELRCSLLYVTDDLSFAVGNK